MYDISFFLHECQYRLNSAHDKLGCIDLLSNAAVTLFHCCLPSFWWAVNLTLYRMGRFVLEVGNLLAIVVIAWQSNIPIHLPCRMYSTRQKANGRYLGLQFRALKAYP